MLEHVIDKRPEADRILIARRSGTARRHVRWRELTESEEAAAVAELRELAGSRADLLAEVAGLEVGYTEGRLDEPSGRQAACLCRKVGADLEAIRHGSKKAGAGERTRAGRRSQANEAATLLVGAIGQILQLQVGVDLPLAKRASQ